MVLFRVMCFIEDKQVDAVDCDEGVHEALVKHFCCTDNYHVVTEMLLPDILRPQVAAHLTTETLNVLIQVTS